MGRVGLLVTTWALSITAKDFFFTIILGLLRERLKAPHSTGTAEAGKKSLGTGWQDGYFNIVKKPYEIQYIGLLSSLWKLGPSHLPTLILYYTAYSSSF
jgi:hypothetical protein